LTTDIILVLLILGAAIVLFASERLRVDLVALLVLLALRLSGLLTTEEAFSGFSNPAVITVWAIYIVSASLTHTGIADFLGRYIGRFAGVKEERLILVLMITVAGMSAFMNNIGATAVLLPVVIRLGNRARVPVSKLLIPLAFGSLLGGVTTLIGTPPNILASDILESYGGLEPFQFFHFFPTGIIVLLIGTVYMVLIGWRLLPDHKAGVTPINTTPVRDFLAELEVSVGRSPMVTGLTGSVISTPS